VEGVGRGLKGIQVGDYVVLRRAYSPGGGEITYVDPDDARTRQERIAGRNTSGGLAEFVTVPLAGVLRLPEGVLVEQAVFGLELAPILEAIGHSGWRPGLAAAVLGRGRSARLCVDLLNRLGAVKTQRFAPEEPLPRRMPNLPVDVAFLFEEENLPLELYSEVFDRLRPAAPVLLIGTGHLNITLPPVFLLKALRLETVSPLRCDPEAALRYLAATPDLKPGRDAKVLALDGPAASINAWAAEPFSERVTLIWESEKQRLFE